jgi:hypothetical protein
MGYIASTSSLFSENLVDNRVTNLAFYASFAGGDARGF